jgi:hypothetical protein
MTENRLFVQSKHNRPYCPFFLLKKGEIGVIFLDANLIRVAPESRDTGGHACLYHDTFG